MCVYTCSGSSGSRQSSHVQLPEPEMLTFPINFLCKIAHFQLRLPSLPFREPDPSQKCLHFQLTFSLKLLIFSSGSLPSLSGSRTRARNANMSFQFSLQNCSFSAPAAFPPFPGAGPEPEMLTFPINFLFKSVYFRLRLPSRPFRKPGPSQKCLHFQLNFFLKVVIFSSDCLPSLSGSRTRARNAYSSN